MKQSFHSIAILFFLVFLIISTSHLYGRKLAAKLEGSESNVNIISSKKSVAKMENTDSLTKLMGLEECHNEDEECLERRVLAEAHLDYIYTEHHKP